jgi:NO-binding membrane sensor protein with MHYT domain
MGGIAIWCMHFIGNRAIVLNQGEAVMQIAYNPGFTVLSFFVPILVLLAAFMTVGSSDTNDKVSLLRVATGGTLAGLAICGMHYLGQAGVSNYTCVYETTHVVGAAVIAVAASTTALSVFFILRAAWTSSWWKRALTAVILAGAVSGMHWLASVGTRYRLRHVDIAGGENLSRDFTVVVVIILVRSILRYCRRFMLTSIVNCGLLYPTRSHIARSVAEV